jgi:hypothetical protein
MDRARTIAHRVAVPGHGAVLDEGALNALIDMNVRLAERVADAILERLAQPTSAEVLLGDLLRRFEAPVADAPSFYLLQPTIFAYLSHLQRQRHVAHEIRGGQSLWMRA